MRITNIKPAVKTKGRFNIFVDNKYSFSLDELQLIELNLKLGDEISPGELEELKGESEFGKNYARALDLILRRPRSEKEIADYARRKNWSDQMKERVTEKLKTKKYLNDEAFVDFWLRARSAVKPSSKRKLIAELRQKGIASETIEQAFLSEDAPDELEALRKVVLKKKTKYQDQQKLIAYLASLGFSYGDIKEVIAEN